MEEEDEIPGERISMSHGRSFGVKGLKMSLSVSIILIIKGGSSGGPFLTLTNGLTKLIEDNVFAATISTATDILRL